MEVGVHLWWIFLVVFFRIPQAFSQDTWDVPPYINIAPREEVKYTQYDPTRGQIINMQEEIEGEVILALFNYKGSETPKYILDIGDSTALGAEIRPGVVVEGKKWYLIITKKQDYEIVSQRRYILSITIGTKVNKLYLNIDNIDDNAPVIQGGTCQVPELYLGITNCTYLVTDADGGISINVMKFKIIGRAGEEKIFKIEEERNDPTEMSMQITLKTIQELDFAESQIHIFIIEAEDSGSNKGEVNAVVQVIDMPNQPPIWKSIFASQTFDEKTSQVFKVEAVDGDTQINKKILYKLIKPDNYTFFSIGNEDGTLKVDPIDRDALQNEVFPFTISAYKEGNESWATTSDVFIIIKDVNDQIPEVLTKEFSITIKEETFVTLDFKPQIFVYDKDLGENAQYTVKLESITPAGAAEAFAIIPNEGYQKQELKLIILDAKLLDYEKIPWQNIQLKVKAVENLDPSHVDTATINIHLTNWNDEEPIFDKTSYSTSFKETVEKGYVVETVHASDRDIDDDVIHSISGSVSSYMEINPKTGVITVTENDAFDFNRQSEIIVQVKAEDVLGEPYHTKYAQLIIQLIDVNNKPPEIRMPSKTVSVKENSPKNHEITREIRGSDPDSEAVIKFSIDWPKSSASKPGFEVKREEFEGCVDIETIYPDSNKKGEALGRLFVKEIRDGVTIDFEEFEVLYLAIVLTDTNQTILPNSAEGTFSLIIEDVNDNAPIWVDGTLTAKRIVREDSDAGILIGSVQATDRDGPLYNNVKYYLEEGANADKDLVKIDPATGQLTVYANKKITCDKPDPREKLFYDLTATDCKNMEDNVDCHKTKGKIEIDIIDINNKNPVPNDDEFKKVVSIEENSPTGTPITTIKSTDLDRDVPYSTVAYTINFDGQQEVLKFFSIDSATGALIVTLNGEDLDRDEGDDKYDIYITLTDNPLQVGEGQRNTGRTMVTVQLLDVNDNAPQLPDGLSWIIKENALKDEELKPVVIAPDKDEPNTDNSRVKYNVLSLKSASSQNPIKFPEDLFGILSPDNVSGILIPNYNLKLYWGSYNIELEAYDLGEPRMNTTKVYSLTVTPYNYERPKFVFPVQNQFYRLKQEDAKAGSLLYFAGKGRFTDISATDPDGLEAGQVEFEIIGKEISKEYFNITNQNNNKGTLTLLKDLNTEDKKFEITIKAKDKGTDPSSLEETVTFTVQFVPTEGAPYFENNSATTKFTECSTGQSHIFSEAIDPKNMACNEDSCKFDIYYFIIKDTPSAEFFELNKVTNELKVVKELNREESVSHLIRIAATNSDEQAEVVLSEKSILNVVVNVRETNPRPKFVQYLYAGGVTLTDNLSKMLFILKATHSEDLLIKYNINYTSMVVDSSLQDVVDNAFKLDEDTGEMLLNFKPLVSMSGMFEFDVIANDTAGKTDEANVKVFMIADNNRISFIFENIEKKVETERKFIADTFTNIFGYQCNIDYILIASDNGIAVGNQTEVKTHFIENDVAIEADRITVQLSDLTLMRKLRDALRERELYLEDFSTDITKTVESLEKMLRIILIVVSSVLGTLCIVLLVAFFVRTKSLNRRLEALSTTKFGSQDSGLNRVGVAVPGTNKHALEGSNPVWNEEIKAPDFDALSNMSGDSDLIGVEDNPQFAYDNSADETPRRNTIFQQNKNTLASRRPTMNNIGKFD